MTSLAAIMVAASMMAVPRAASLYESLKLYKAVRYNFRGMVVYAANNCEQGASIYVIDYELMGLREKEFYSKSNNEKIHLMKTMGRAHLDMFLEVMGRADLEVKMLTEFDRSRARYGPEYILVYNEAEDNYVRNNEMRVHKVFEIIRGDELAVVYKII